MFVFPTVGHSVPGSQVSPELGLIPSASLVSGLWVWTGTISPALLSFYPADGISWDFSASINA